MTIRLLGLSEEERLEFEQATGIKTEAAQLIVDASVQETQRLIDTAIREIQTVIGPHGSVTRLQSGGVRIGSSGIGVYADGILKTSIIQDGNLFVGSDIDSPSTTTLCVFVNEQIYNNELMGAGDLLFGDNTSGSSNVKFDASEGQLQFRYGQTVNVYMDTDGSIKFGAGTGWLDDGGVQLLSEGLLVLANGYKFVDPTDTSKIVGGVYQIVRHAPNNDSYTELRAHTQDASLTSVYASVDAVSSATATARLTADSGANAGAAAVLKVVQTGAAGIVSFDNVDRVQMAVNDRIEFGADHYIAMRGSSNPNTYFNEANQDMDTFIRSVNDDNMFVVDAGLDGIGIAGAAESGYKLKVTGDVKVTGTLNATFLFPFATYVDLNPITTTGKYPYAGTADRDMAFVRLVQAVYSSAAHDSSNYYTLTLKLRQEGAADVTVCSVDTKNLTTSTVSGYVDTMTTTTFTTASMTGTGYIYMEVTKTGSPADIIVPCPALLCRG